MTNGEPAEIKRNGRSRILIVDDHPVVALGLRLLFSEDPAIEVLGEAHSVAEARSLTAIHKPEYTVLDLVLGGRDGVELIADLLSIHPAAKLIVYSAQDERHYARRALQAGARGYVSKSENLPVVAAAVKAVAAGDLFFSPAIQQTLLRGVARGAAAQSPHDSPYDSPYDLLSNREVQVLRLIGLGFSPQDIAAELSLSVKTVGTYRERTKIKLGLDRARELEQMAADFARPGGHP